MLELVLTALAGIACGIVGMRIWQSQTRRLQGASAGVDSEIAAAGVGSPGSINRTRLLLLGAAALAVLATAVFAFRGESGRPPEGAPGATPNAPAGANAEQLADVDTMIASLAARLEQNPDDGEGFRMLGWSYLMTNRPKEALAPYKRARELLPDNAGVHAGYGEVLVALADRKVTPEAKASFDKALSLDPSEPRALFFQGLYKAQNGQEQAALDDWIRLANSSPPDAQWQGDVRQEITRLAQKLGVDVSGRLKAAASSAAVPVAGARPPALDAATIEAAQQMSPSEQEKMIEGMVEGLAKRLKADPSDANGWARLIRSRMVRGQVEQATRDLATARSALAKDRAGLALVEAGAKEAGVPGA